ncbi:MAG TPA: SDR family oxidoreductase [Candidatus Binataceae bacterium]|nr:SDR family oxidoreductase [Candidatus Binataceae bacterium]
MTRSRTERRRKSADRYKLIFGQPAFVRRGRTERRIALITGAGRGLGRAIALKLAGKGFALALTARGFEELAETRRLSGLAAYDALIILADLSLDDAPDQIFGAMIEHYGRLDVLVNAAYANAGNSSLLELEAAEQDRLLAVNLRAPIALARMACQRLRKQAGGTIVNFVRSNDSPRINPVTAAIEAGIVAFSQAAAGNLLVEQIRIAAIPIMPFITASAQSCVSAAFQVRPTCGHTSTVDDVMAFIEAGRDGRAAAAVED